MKILLKKDGNRFEVTDNRLGAVPVGRGRTMYEALGSYLLNNQEFLDVYIDVDESVQATEDRRRQRELAKR